MVQSLFILALLIPLSACVETGDFGRRKSAISSSKSGFDFAPERAASAYALTEDESELRARAALFQKPPRAPLWPALDALDDAIGSYPDMYYGRLAGEKDQSPVARYRRLSADIEADRAAIAPFRLIRCRVGEADAARTRLMDATLVPEPEYSELLRRIAENDTLARDIENRMRFRRDLYQQSLARLARSSPYPEAKSVQRLIDALHNEISAKSPC